MTFTNLSIKDFPELYYDADNQHISVETLKIIAERYIAMRASQMKPTRQRFEKHLNSITPHEGTYLRRHDPILFDVLFQDWCRNVSTLYRYKP